MDAEIQKRVQTWLDGPYDMETKEKISLLLKEDPKQLVDAFYTDLSFGTAGLRGIMGVGTNRMNEYIVEMTTQGLSNYLLQKKKSEPIHVVIGFDSRSNSSLFAEKTASVLAANGITAYLLNEIRPTPFVSFICREKKCTAAIMITASHNPPEYNGYKVYWSDGAQVVPPHDVGIINEVRKITSMQQVKMAASTSPFIERIGDEWDEEYIKAISTLQNYPEECKSKGFQLRIVYTSLHGTGITLAPRALRKWGFTSIDLVADQVIPDGNFPTVHFPNPELKPALEKGVQVLKEIRADILLATDPDADRIGVVTLEKGEPVYFTGNEIASICVEYLCDTLTKLKKVPSRGAFITTIVTTELLKKIASSYGIACFEVLTGFKYIGEMIHSWDNSETGYHFIFGAEESCGYLLGSFARDKDAVVSACLLSEIALHCKLQNMTFSDYLARIYKKYGVYKEKQLSMSFSPGKEGEEEISSIMHHLREHLPTEFAGKKVFAIEDYQKSTRYILQSSKEEHLHLPVSDVLVFIFEDQSKLVIRPSGTEPKVKFYGSSQLPSKGNLEEEKKECERLVDDLLKKSQEFCKNILSK
ncbi:MAG: phospho-sugar mutase [Chlamydiae bacterium]|nr:phospho-sugar mutase [Chlamydiota bacterium]